MVRAALLAVLVAGCFRVGPVKVGLMPGMRQGGGNVREDPTKPLVAEPVQPSGEGGVAAAGADPLSKGPASGGVSFASFLLWRIGGFTPFLGAYGTFDETGLVELDPEQRALAAEAAKQARDEALDRARTTREE